jgi:hypothetical protein
MSIGCGLAWEIGVTAEALRTPAFTTPALRTGAPSGALRTGDVAALIVILSIREV